MYCRRECCDVMSLRLRRADESSSWPFYPEKLNNNNNNNINNNHTPLHLDTMNNQHATERVVQQLILCRCHRQPCNENNKYKSNTYQIYLIRLMHWRRTCVLRLTFRARTKIKMATTNCTRFEWTKVLFSIRSSHGSPSADNPTSGVGHRLLQFHCSRLSNGRTYELARTQTAVIYK